MTINLIPPKLKLHKELNTILGQVVFGLAVILIMLAIMSGALFIYNSSLQSDVKKTTERLAVQDKRLKDYSATEKLITNANKKLDKIDEVLSEKSAWSEQLTKISSYTPKNIQIKTMDLNIETNKNTISGIAVTRREIALFKERLEENGFKNVIFSSSTYNQGTDDYTFSLTFELEKK